VVVICHLAPVIEQAAAEIPRWTRLVFAALAAAALGLLFAASPAAGAEAKLAGVVWTDGDRDGIRDAGEPGRKGVRVEILREGKRGSLTVVRAILTKASGAWSAPAGSTGKYRARVLLPPSTAGFAPRNRGRNDRVDSDVAVAGPRFGMTPQVRLERARPTRRFDAGLLPISAQATLGPLVTIGDFVWRDGDADGIQDLSEGGLAGVTVELWDAAKATLLASTTTNAAGYWALPGHAGTSYRVRVPGPDQPSPMGAGSDRSRDSDLNPAGFDAGFSDAFTPGASVVDLDAGLFMVVGDFVWDDLDSNGVQGPGEPGVANVTVQLWNGAKNLLVDQDTTDAAGRYRLLVPEAGSYRVRVLVPAGFTGFAPKDAGGSDELDSDVNPSGSDLQFTDPFSFPGGVNQSFDVGLF
jgi:SdrD B-like domain